jgi:hypothetical protein
MHACLDFISLFRVSGHFKDMSAIDRVGSGRRALGPGSGMTGEAALYTNNFQVPVQEEDVQIKVGISHPEYSGF